VLFYARFYLYSMPDVWKGNKRLKEIKNKKCLPDARSPTSFLGSEHM